MWLEDLKFALRALLKNPGSSLVVIAILALGIGANTAIFSVVDAVLLKPLPYPDATELVVIWETNAELGQDRDGPAPGNVLDWRERNQVFTGIAASRQESITYLGESEALELPSARVTADFFPVMGTGALLGRTMVINADTVLRDRLSNADQPTAITLDELNLADRLEVNAYRDTSGNLIATRVERTEVDPLVVVKGPADAKMPTTQLTLAGFDVTTGPDSLYRDASGNLVDAVSFYDAVLVPPAAATVVHARGMVADLTADVVDATRSTSTIGELEIGGY